LQLPKHFVWDIIKDLTSNDIKIEALDLSGNIVGIQGCKYLNILAQRSKTLKEIKVDFAHI